MVIIPSGLEIFRSQNTKIPKNEIHAFFSAVEWGLLETNSIF